MLISRKYIWNPYDSSLATQITVLLIRLHSLDIHPDSDDQDHVSAMSSSDGRNSSLLLSSSLRDDVIRLM